MTGFDILEKGTALDNAIETGAETVKSVADVAIPNTDLENLDAGELVDMAGDVMDWLVPEIVQDAAASAFDATVEAAGQVASEIGDAISDGAEHVYNKAAEAIENKKNEIVQDFNETVDNVTEAIVDTANGVVDGITSIPDRIEDGVEYVYNEAVDLKNDTVNGFYETVAATEQGIKNAFHNGVEAVGNGVEVAIETGIDTAIATVKLPYTVPKMAMEEGIALAARGWDYATTPEANINEVLVKGMESLPQAVTEVENDIDFDNPFLS